MAGVDQEPFVRNPLYESPALIWWRAHGFHHGRPPPRDADWSDSEYDQPMLGEEDDESGDEEFYLNFYRSRGELAAWRLLPHAMNMRPTVVLPLRARESAARAAFIRWRRAKRWRATHRATLARAKAKAAATPLPDKA